MVILLITGPICSGKSFIANYIAQNYEYTIHKLTLSETPVAATSKRDMKQIDDELQSALEIAMLDFKRSHVIYPIIYSENVEALVKKRSYIKIVSISAPLLQRYKMFCSKMQALTISYEENKTTPIKYNRKVSIENNESIHKITPKKLDFCKYNCENFSFLKNDENEEFERLVNKNPKLKELCGIFENILTIYSTKMFFGKMQDQTIEEKAEKLEAKNETNVKSLKNEESNEAFEIKKSILLKEVNEIVGNLLTELITKVNLMLFNLKGQTHSYETTPIKFNIILSEEKGECEWGIGSIDSKSGTIEEKTEASQAENITHVKALEIKKSQEVNGVIKFFKLLLKLLSLKIIAKESYDQTISYKERPNTLMQYICKSGTLDEKVIARNLTARAELVEIYSKTYQEECFINDLTTGIITMFRNKFKDEVNSYKVERNTSIKNNTKFTEVNCESLCEIPSKKLDLNTESCIFEEKVEILEATNITNVESSKNNGEHEVLEIKKSTEVKKDIENLLTTTKMFCDELQDHTISDTLKNVEAKEHIEISGNLHSVKNDMSSIQKENKVSNIKTMSLEEFVELDDYFNFESGLKELAFHSHIKIINRYSEELLRKELERHLTITNKLFRPSWDQYFMRLAYFVKERSNCMKRSVGAIIVNDRNRIVSTGYNGIPWGKNCYEGGCERCNSNIGQGEKLWECKCFHAEESALFEFSHGQHPGSTLYTTLSPCKYCTTLILNSTVTRVVYHEEYKTNAHTKALFEKIGIKYDKIDLTY